MEAPKPLHALLLPWRRQGTEEEKHYIFSRDLTLCGLNLNLSSVAQTHSSVGLAGPEQRLALLLTRDQWDSVGQICVQ